MYESKANPRAIKDGINLLLKSKSEESIIQKQQKI